jgi:hypothetical protein
MFTENPRPSTTSTEVPPSHVNYPVYDEDGGKAQEEQHLATGGGEFGGGGGGGRGTKL